MSVTEYKKYIAEVSNEKLIVELQSITVTGTHEANSRRGESAKTARKELALINEIAKRFELDYTEIVRLKNVNMV